MPYVNGQYHRSAGQGYAVEKAKMGAKKSEGGDDKEHGAEDKEKGPQEGSVIHVKHHGGGKMSVKHEDGSVSQHEGMADLHDHIAEHFGLNDEGQGDGDGDEDYEGSEGGDALKSILG